MNRRVTLLLLICVLPLLAGQDRFAGRRLAWAIPADLEAVLITLDQAVNENLPAPVLDHEMPYTRGTDNEVSWNDSMNTVFDTLQNLAMSVSFYAIEARITGIDTVWGFVGKDKRSALFTGLPEGVPVAYRLRYYATDAAGETHISPWSEPEISVQDASAPLLNSVRIEAMQDACNNPWVIGPQIRIAVQAADANGQIMQVAIQEESGGLTRNLFDDLDANPRAVVDTTLLYTILTDPNTPLTLNFWVVDVAEFTSDTMSLSFFYLPEDPELVCFPNPFLPDQNQCTMIKVEKPGIQIAKIFDPFGNLVRTLRKNPQSDLAFEWDGRNEKGDRVANGGYICIVDGNRDLYCKIAVIR